MTPERALAESLAAAPDGQLGVAVSGGGDSVALLLLMHAAGRAAAAVTVDHGLRPGSAGEAAVVSALCAARGLPHETLCWDGGAAGGNLQDRARRGRRALIAGWAARNGLAAVALGHTLDDQAETFLMRLARGSGVDGLSGMAPASRAEGVLWLRPLLSVRRAELRQWLAARGQGWAEDPGNEDPRFDRTRARAALPLLDTLGLGAGRLAATAATMARARAALEAATAALAAEAVAQGPAGDLALDPARLAAAPKELRLRLLAGALSWVSGAVYRPRLARLSAVLLAIEAGQVGRGLTLHGCVLRVEGSQIAVRREPARVAPEVPLADGRWDGRWLVEGGPPDPVGLSIGALGADGLAEIGRQPGDPPRESLWTTPAVRRYGLLIAAPVARPRSGSFCARRISAIVPPWLPE